MKIPRYALVALDANWTSFTMPMTSFRRGKPAGTTISHPSESPTLLSPRESGVGVCT
jgi:hypothetical protein